MAFPEKVLQKIADYLTLEDKFHMRQVNSTSRYVVDRVNPRINEMAIYCHMPVPEMTHLVSILRNSTLRLERLSIGDNRETLPKIYEWLLEDLKHKVHTERFYSASVVLSAPLFPHLHPGTLRDVHLVVGKDKTSIDSLKQVVKSKACEELDRIFIQTFLSPNKFPFKSFEHLSRIEVQFFGPSCSNTTPAILKRFMNNATNLESLRLINQTNPFDFRLIIKSLNRPSKIVQIHDDGPNFRNNPIRGSTDIFGMEFSDDSISIERKH